MIRPNELRMGNRAIRKGVHVTVDGISIWEADHGREQYEGIPLTPEILEKAGFDLSVKWWAGITINDYEIHVYLHMEDFGSVNLFSKKQSTQEDVIYLSKKVEYLHQLQNLYFALTGEELNIEL